MNSKVAEWWEILYFQGIWYFALDGVGVIRQEICFDFVIFDESSTFC